MSSEVSTSIYAFLKEVASDIQKATARAAMGATTLLEVLGLRDQPDGLAGLDSDGNLPITRLINRTGTTAELSVIVLEEGEFAYATDSGLIHKGDGATPGGVIEVTTVTTLGLTNAGGAGQLGGGANSTTGGALGNGAASGSGGAVGSGAAAVDGFGGGDGAVASAAGAVQLGTGVNPTANTIKFLDSEPVTAEEFGRLSRANTITYRIPDVDLTAAGFSNVIMKQSKTFMIREIVIHMKTIDTWTIAPTDVEVGFCDNVDPAGTFLGANDNMCQVITESTSSWQPTDANTSPFTSDGLDSVAVSVLGGATATTLIADIFVTGFEY